MRIVGLIPARGGSKGILRKNLQAVGENSLVAIKILQARASNCNEIWVSTEDLEIASISKQNGAKIIERPIALAEDDTSTDDMLIHAAETLKLGSSDFVILLQPTSPLIKLSSVNKCIQMLLENPELSSVITLRQAHPFIWEQTEVMNWDPSGHTRKIRPRRQELSPSGYETGGCYAIRVQSLYEQRVRYPRPTGAIPVNHIEAIDIDTLEDLSLANSIFGLLNSTTEDRIF
jgi:CMP-N-acetylneuraminic acid synthetase